MPQGDKRGPGVRGAGSESGIGRGGGGRGQQGGFRAGPGGNCICPKCGERAAHQRGTPCFEQKCPKCGEAMTRR